MIADWMFLMEMAKVNTSLIDGLRVLFMTGVTNVRTLPYRVCTRTTLKRMSMGEDRLFQRGNKVHCGVAQSRPCQNAKKRNLRQREREKAEDLPPSFFYLLPTGFHSLYATVTFGCNFCRINMGETCRSN